MSINLNDDLNRAYLEGLTARLEKKRVKLGELTKELGKLQILEDEILEEIKVIKNTIHHAQDSNN
tara:strand:+ start:10905 stop:11099 length:195 start_codon:yes stop_codon:yes gene_type:complete